MKAEIIKTDSFKPIRDSFVELVDEKTFNREIGFAVQAIHSNPKLAECSTLSLQKAVYNVALTGLSLNPLDKLAYLTPRWNTKAGVTEAILSPSYQGMSKLAMAASNLTKIEARLVYENDEYYVEYEPSEHIVHRPVKMGKDRGKMIGAYAIATLSNGVKQFEQMTTEELYEIRSYSDSWQAFEAGKIKSAIWKSHEGEMCKKTVIKRLTKYLPKVANKQLVDRFNEAVKLDNLDFMASDDQLSYMEVLLHTSNLDEDRKEGIEAAMGMGDMTRQQASDIIGLLKANQTNALTERGMANQGEVQKQLDRHI